METPAERESFLPHTHAVLIPAYKSARLLEGFLPTLLRAVTASQILVVDDGSDDDTPDVCAAHGVECLILSVNRGKGAALRTGFSLLAKEGYDWIITMDADGQHAVDDLIVFEDTIRDNPSAGMIIGARDRHVGKMPLERIFSNTLTSAILSFLAKQGIADSQCGYRAYSANFVQNVSFSYNRFEMESEVILRGASLGFPILFVRVQTLYCSDLSHISHLKDTFRWLTAVLRTWWKIKSRMA